ncbi:hypothetical protein LguiB_011678 [Lonicera macranthoides]
MDDAQENSRYPSKHYNSNHHSSYNSLYRSNSKRPTRNPNYNEEDDDDDNGYENDELEEENQGFNEDEEDDDEDEYQNGYSRIIESNDDTKRHQKKRRLDGLYSKYEFAPRVNVNLQKNSSDWTDNESFVLLEIWGDRFLQLGRKSLRNEDWVEVAEKLSEVCKLERDHIMCRNRLDNLKKKYKKEKAKMEEMGGYYGKWPFFKKMDMLLNASPRQQNGLACGVDSGEYVFMNPRVYLNQSNALDEMRDSPGESSEEEDDDDSDGLPPKRKEGDNGLSFRLVADSIQKFGEIYEKIEDNKRQQMMELEKMRMDFHRDLELQKSQILERAQAEIAKIRQGGGDDDDDDDTDVSAENTSG